MILLDYRSDFVLGVVGGIHCLYTVSIWEVVRSWQFPHYLHQMISSISHYHHIGTISMIHTSIS